MVEWSNIYSHLKDYKVDHEIILIKTQILTAQDSIEDIMVPTLSHQLETNLEVLAAVKEIKR